MAKLRIVMQPAFPNVPLMRGPAVTAGSLMGLAFCGKATILFLMTFSLLSSLSCWKNVAGGQVSAARQIEVDETRTATPLNSQNELHYHLQEARAVCA